MIRLFVALIAGIYSGLMIYLISFTAGWVYIISLVFFWLIGLSWFYYYVYYKSPQKWLHYSLLVMTILCLSTLMLFVEWNFLYYLILILGMAEVGFIFYRLPLPEKELPYKSKPLRRGIMMLWVFDVYVFLSTVFAVNIYFPGSFFWLLDLLVFVVVFFSSLIVWKNYLNEDNKKMYFLAAVISLAMAEICWVLHWLTLGHFVLGLVATWIWYLSVLLSRFNLVDQGINWKKQSYFLLINGLLLFIVLFWLVKWL